MAPGSIFNIEIGADGAIDQLAAGGRASVDGVRVQFRKETGGRLLNNAGNGSFLGATGEILTAAGGITGTLRPEVTTDFNFLGGVLTASAGSVMLTLSRNAQTFASFAGSSNGRAVAYAIDQMSAGTPIYEAILGSNAPQNLASVFDGLSGGIHAEMATALMEESHYLRDTALTRAMPRLPGDTSDGSVPVTVDASGAMTAYLQSLGSWGRRDGTDGNRDAERSTQGFLAGFDATFDPAWRAGVVSGYSDGRYDLSGYGGSGSGKTYQVGIYGGRQWGSLGVRGGLAYARQNVETNRSFAVPGLTQEMETAKYAVDTGQIFGEIGYQLGDQDLGFEPFANLALVGLRGEDFKESSGVAALRSDGLSDSMALQTLGVHATSKVQLGEIDLKATGMLGWRHAYGDGASSARLAMVAGGPSFTAESTHAAKDAFVVNAGLEGAITSTLSAGISYQGLIAAKASENSLKASMKFKF